MKNNRIIWIRRSYQARKCGFHLSLVTALALTWAASYPVRAADGDLDTTFSFDGKVTTDFGGDDRANAVVIDANGKIIVVGYGYGGSLYSDFALARYNADGTLDDSFGTHGKVTTDFAGFSDVATAIAIDVNGKIVVTGSANDGTKGDNFAVARYNTDGTLDSSFGSNGKVTTGFTSHNDVANGIAIDANGKIVVAGTASKFFGNSDFALARFNADGTLDSSFGTGGKVTTDYAGDTDEGNAIAIDAQGKIVVAGVFRDSTGPKFGVSRYNTDGSLDSDFNANGKVATDIPIFGDAGSASASAVIIGPDGKIVLAGQALLVPGDLNFPPEYGFALVRYNGDGTLDPTFGASGKVTIHYSGGIAAAAGIILDVQGRIVVGGFSEGYEPGPDKFPDLSTSDFALARLNANGSLDSSFSADGIVTTDFTGDQDSASGVTIDANGKIVVVGYSRDSGGNYNFALARYSASSCKITCPADIQNHPSDVNQCGAIVNYPAPTTSGTCGTVSCTPPSGSLFPVGTTTVTCSDSAGGQCSFTVTVVDTQPPSITCPSDVRTPGTSAAGAVVNYSASASDNCTGVTLSCIPPSGSQFPMGATTVNCTASDTANQAACHFTVTVLPPCTITCPGNISQPNDPNQCGAIVTYPAPTTTGGCGTITCTPASGSLFPVGTTTVNCSSSVGNQSCTFSVTVRDTQPPSITCPANVIASGTSASGAVVTYPAPTATDNCSGMSITCSPPSGSQFPLGTTIVNCTATDAAGNHPSCAFSVTVERADLAISSLAAPAKASPGQNITYSIIVTNIGPGTARDVLLSDPVPANCTFVSATGPVSFAPAPGANGTVIWSSSSLANGGRLSVTITVKVSTKGKGSVTNTASISSSSFDPVPANNTATGTTRLPAQGK